MCVNLFGYCLGKGGSFEVKKSPVCSEVDNVVSSVVNVNSE